MEEVAPSFGPKETAYFQEICRAVLLRGGEKRKCNLRWRPDGAVLKQRVVFYGRNFRTVLRWSTYIFRHVKTTLGDEVMHYRPCTGLNLLMFT
ncbi:hypothetical protein CA54_23800 [Symmachiella macrocystis]|uniref:Uncharacterized protein n=1 Tax=Symmachiella macrocystis TaxID=2527985 RepID=A0A5C6BNF1_9PLAN|nr:hypothetical protein CA54_23800 [Symmachiella macrocystis]